MRIAQRAERIEPFYVMEVAKAAATMAKEFGGTDGHKYVNAVLNVLAPAVRAAEVARDRPAAARAAT